MTAEFVTPAQVRAYLDVDGTARAYADALVSSNIRAASAYLERATGRQFEAQTGATKTFTTNGAASIQIPDLRTVTSVTLQGAALTADESYWAISDNHGVVTTLQLRPYGTGSYPNYKANPQWFDRNLDRDFYRYGGYGSLPNDLVIVGDWGHEPLPEDLLHACKVLSAWYTRRPASVLANSQITPEGNQLNFSALPPEVERFIADWRLGSMLIAI